MKVFAVTSSVALNLDIIDFFIQYLQFQTPSFNSWGFYVIICYTDDI